MPLVALVLLLSALISVLFLWALIPQLSRRLLDQPNFRSSHLRPIPRGGGVSFVLLGSAASVIALVSVPATNGVALPLLAAPLAFVGLIDDRHNLPASWRYGFQLITAALIIGSSPLVHLSVFVPLSGSLLILPVGFFLLISVTAVINFTNFMDGLDGLVAGCMFLAMSALCLFIKAPWSLWVLLGSLFGFLLWNWSPAKVFMGDVGSTFLGAVFAGLVLQASTWTESLGYLLVATPLLADAFFCVLRRFLAGQPVFQAHRLHLFQRLNQAGWSHSRVSLMYISATLILVLAMVAGSWSWVLGLAVTELFIGIWLDQCVAVPFVVASER